MSESQDEKAAARFQYALDMFAFGESLMLERLRREHPNADGTQLEHLMGEWLHTRPGAEHGDVVGRPLPIPESPESR